MYYVRLCYAYDLCYYVIIYRNSKLARARGLTEQSNSQYRLLLYTYYNLLVV